MHHNRLLILAVTLGISGYAGLIRADDLSLFVANESSGTIRQISTTGADLGVLIPGLKSPVNITLDSANNLYIPNYTGASVQEFSPQGSLIRTFATSFQPGDTSIAADGTVLINDYYGGAVYKYSSSGQYEGLFAKLNLSRADFSVFDASGNLYVSSFLAGVIRKISPDGTTQSNFVTGAYGVGGMVFDSMGNLYASFDGPYSSAGHDMIRKYSSTGVDLGAIVTTTGLSRPAGMAFGPDGILYVANWGNNTIHEFSPSGTDLGVFATTGLGAPRDLAFSTTVVPEPMSLSLIGFGFAGLILRRRQR